MLLSGMQIHTAPRQGWRTLTSVEKQARLAGLRQRQQQQLAHDARVLRLHEA